MSDRDCPHMTSCPMYELFTHAGTLGVWKTNYCKGEFERCARFQAAKQGRQVPIQLLPNGSMLRRPQGEQR